MSVSIYTASAPSGLTDGWIRSSSTSSYGNALFGANFQVNTSDDLAVVGATYTSGTWYVRQYFTTFQYVKPANQIAVAGYFRLQNSTTHGTNVARDTEIREFDWGTTLEGGNPGDWRRPSGGIAAATISAVIERSHMLPNNYPAFAGFMRIRGELGGVTSTKTLKYFMNTTRNRLEQNPSGVEYNSFLSSRTANSSHRPQLYMGHHTQSLNSTVLAAQTQLSDGSWIYLERDSTNEEFNLSVKHRSTGGTVTTVASNYTTGLTGNDNLRSAQGFGLCADASDNFFVTYPRFINTEQLAIRAYRKGVGNTWVQGPELFWSNLTDDNYANTMQLLCAWHGIGTGRLVIFSMRDWGRYGNAQDTYFLADSQKILDGQSNFILASGKGGSDGWLAKPSTVGNYNSINPTGTLMDLVPDAVDAHSGYILSAERAALLGQNAATSVGRYRIHSNGNSFNTFTFSFMDNDGGFSMHDPDSKLRAISVGKDRLVKIAADERKDWGLTADVFAFNSTANSYSRLGRVRMANMNISTFPDRSNNELVLTSKLHATQLWDAVYFPVENKIWIYYLDDGNQRRLMRTSINLNDNLATGTTVEVATNMGVAATGYAPLSLRVQRNNMRSDNCLVTFAYRNGTSHFNQYVSDRINVAPTQPILNPVTNFNATSAKTFSWTFADPNFVDNQSAYEIEIVQASNPSNIVNPGKITSTTSSRNVAGGTLTNGINYLWRVRTYDSTNTVSPWSSQGAFTTSNAGLVNITKPAADNEEIFTKDVLVEWTLTGVTSQQDYRVVVTRVSDGVQHSDTNWVTSTTKSHTITDLLSDVEYRVEVTCRNSGVLSNTDVRYVTVMYNSPEVPEVTVSVLPDLEYVTVAVTNPEPRGDRPNPTVNDIYRRRLGSTSPFQWIGDCEPNTSFRDYTVGSGYNYEYKVRAGVE